MSHPVPHATLVIHACRALGGLSQREVGDLLGVSRRTINRWTARGTTLTAQQSTTLARHVLPVDRELAVQIAATQGATLLSLGLESPVAAMPPPDPRPDPLPLAVDAVVCTAAEALDVSPRMVRPALLAAFRRAREAGLTMEQVEQALTPPAASRKK